MCACPALKKATITLVVFVAIETYHGNQSPSSVLLFFWCANYHAAGFERANYLLAVKGFHHCLHYIASRKTTMQMFLTERPAHRKIQRTKDDKERGQRHRQNPMQPMPKTKSSKIVL